MNLSREIVHGLLDQLLDLGKAHPELEEARRHFLLAKREALLGALALVDHSLKAEPKPAVAEKPAVILVED